ncbi:hypothetical protein [Quisquiliibacterium transsilvanicum]|uniref:2-oxoglutarate dehydrogenase complex dehydrogenase (E1) component-like enzyme n=1 Tax=Quisquiliibacterium transsilvanicum TaxID=1549638 RepID=A0A7W8M8R3_9BURK|nr:hypothetical protein [Quisquiliibacterium transsilvanicum]MBB5271555.1 2-oxoglutarate dehydrogenase complex dehydrogenase (E1) component-like enzyme [Quisquiliibacterium transsilvanicum]
MDPFSIAALVATIGGAAIQYDAARNAQKAQEAATRQSLERQRKLQMEAEKKAMDTAENYETPKRAAEQEQIADQITQELIAPVSESQAIRAQQQTTQGNVSGDYQAAKAKSDLETMKAAEQLARLLGKTTSASRLRMNEGIRLMDAGMDVDRLANFSRGQYGADQIAINAAGQADPGQMFLGSLLQGVGSAGLSSGSGSLSASGAGLKYGAGGQQSAMLAAQEAGMGTGGLWNLGGAARDGFNSFAKAFK